MTTPCLTATNDNFNCVIKASLELINLPLIDILACHVKDVDLFNKINSCQTLLSGRNPLRTDQLKICFLKPPAKPDYRQFDVTLLYKLIRNLCPLLRPTQGWGNKPQSTDTQLGDDIERLRLFRNNYYAHVVSKTIPDTEFEILWRDLKSVIRRIQSKCQTVCSLSYERELIAIENSKFTHDYLKKCEMLLEAFLKLQTDERDEPKVVIEGKDEVLCGDLARFVAVLKPDSSCWSITWQKRRGKVTETIDTSTKKYSGSTNRKLVIQSVCKEDEGEYQVLLPHKSNQNGYLICGNTICLHVFGEMPYLNDLEVTTGDKRIIIHYEISGQSPEVQRIDWKKDGQVLNINVCKYIGGSINDSSLTIRSPTEEDKGKYSCIITNAIGSVSKDVILDAPSVDIEVNPTVYFGSKATITAVVSSTPPPEQVIWQKSKDGNNFYCIDITKPNYYGSNDIPFKPLLVILKATFDDKQNYRLLVRNKIRDSISETVHLNVTGSPPNITTSQETNIKCKRLKLIGNVSLYDNSPDILEVFWKKNGEKIDARGSGGRLSEVTIDNPSLIIRDVNVNDAGNYQLTAVNAVGSTTSDVIVLDAPGVSFENTENKKDGTERYVVTIQSVPSPLFVQWSSKGKNEDVYTPIDCNEEDYKGTLNTIPHPVLVVKKSHHENYNYQIEVTNFVGCTVKQISDNQHHPTENITTENKVYKERNAGIKFAKLSNYLAKHFPHQELHYLKLMLLASGKVENVSALKSAKSASECFTVLHEENLFTQKDVIFMQFLCKETGCDELYSQCIEYATTNKALCYFEKQPENGYENVQFHIQGNLNDYSKEQIEHIVEVVADILDCETQDIFVNGVKPSNSFFLVLSLREDYTWKLSEMNEQNRSRLLMLNIDFFVIDLKTIFLQSSNGGECKKEGTQVNYNRSTQNRFRKYKMKRKQEKTLKKEKLEGKKRSRTLSEQEHGCTGDIDHTKDKLCTRDDFGVHYTRSDSRCQSLSPFVRSLKAETHNKPDDRDTSPLYSSAHLLSQSIEKSDINIKIRNVQDIWRPLNLSGITSNEQEHGCTGDKDHTNDKLCTRDDVGVHYTVSKSRCQSLSPFVRSWAAETLNNLDDRGCIKMRTEKPHVNETSDMQSVRKEIPRGHLPGSINLGHASLFPIEDYHRKQIAKDKPFPPCPNQSPPRNVLGAFGNLTDKDHDNCSVIQKINKIIAHQCKILARHQSKTVHFYNNEREHKDNIWLQTNRSYKLCFDTGGECKKEGTQVNYTRSTQNRFRKYKMKRKQEKTLKKEKLEGKKRSRTLSEQEHGCTGDIDHTKDKLCTRDDFGVHYTRSDSRCQSLSPFVRSLKAETHNNPNDRNTSPLYSSAHLLSQSIEKSDINIKIRNVQDIWRPLNLSGITSNEQEHGCTGDKDHTNDKLCTRDDVGVHYTVSDSRCQSLSPFVRSWAAETLNNLDDRGCIKMRTEKPHVNETSEMQSVRKEIPRGHLPGSIYLGHASLSPIEDYHQKQIAKDKPCPPCPNQSPPRNVPGPFGNLTDKDHDHFSPIQMVCKQIVRHQSETEYFYNNEREHKDDIRLQTNQSCKLFFDTGRECKKEVTQVIYSRSRQNRYRKYKMKRRQAKTMKIEKPEGKKRSRTSSEQEHGCTGDIDHKKDKLCTHDDFGVHYTVL